MAKILKGEKDTLVPVFLLGRRFGGGDRLLAPAELTPLASLLVVQFT